MSICGDDVRFACPLFQTERGGYRPTSPLQLTFKECSLDTARELVQLWHSRLPETNLSNLIRSGLVTCFVAEFNGEYFATAIWTRPIAANRLKDGMQLMELRRMAIADDAPKNTATRMLSFMRRFISKSKPDVIRLISYQDTAVHNGTIYKADNWIPVLIGGGVSWASHKDSARAGEHREQYMTPKVRWEYGLRC